VDRDAALFVRTLDDHAANAGLNTFLFDERFHLEILKKHITVVFGVCIPAAIPGAVDLKTHTDWVDFITH
jgi:hypothetical protein